MDATSLLRRLRAAAVPVLLLAACAGASAGPARLRELRVANYNVENLFDAELNSPTNALTGEPGDAEWCASSWRRWTEARYRLKLSHLAWVVDQMKPDILVLEEVENAAVCRALADTVRKEYHWTLPHLAHRESRDPRGIDVAILSRYPIRRVSYHPKLGRRGLLMADLDVDGTTVVVFASHFKSQIGDPKENHRIRSEEARHLREEMRRRLEADPDAVVLALGDYNENMDGPALAAGLRPANDRRTALASLHGPDPLDRFRPFNLVGDIPKAERGSFYYAPNKVWNTFDGAFVPPRMLLPADEPGPAWRVGRPEETVTFHRPEMRWGEDGRPNAFRRQRRYVKGSGGDQVEEEVPYTEGYSDHFPILFVLHRAAE